MGTYDPLLSDLGPGDVLLDAGANIGVFSILAASRVKRVIAVEPNAQNYDMLCANIELNGAKNVVPVHAALSDSEGEALFDGTGEVGHLSSRGTRVRTATISSLPGGGISAIKADIEGAEALALMAPGSLEGVRFIAYEPDFTHTEEVYSSRGLKVDAVKINQELVAYLRASGYDIRYYATSGVQVAKKVLSPYVFINELATGWLGTRSYVHFYLRTGRDLLRPRTLGNPELHTTYAVKMNTAGDTTVDSPGASNPRPQSADLLLAKTRSGLRKNLSSFEHRGLHAK